MFSFKKILTVGFLFITLWVFAQLYPVQVTPQLTPPYNTRLSDYATTSQEKLYVQLLMNDVTVSNRQVRLRMTIKQGSTIIAQNNDFITGANPINLTGGIPTRLSNLDLRPYFQLENLNGISPTAYNRPLNDGFYFFCFEVFDYNTGQRLSNADTGCTGVSLVLNDPPVLNLPQNGENINVQNPQNILFNWTPRHLNAPNTQYQFELVEIWDPNLAPQQAFLSSPPIWTEISYAPTFLYDVSKTPLQAGKRYAWRVQAVTGNGLINESSSSFRNNGYSEIFYFTYSNECQAPEYILSELRGTRSAKILWQDDARFDDYKIQYRKVQYTTKTKKKRVTNEVTGKKERKEVTTTTRKDGTWFELESKSAQAIIQSLEPNTVYEYRVGGHCTEGFAGLEKSYSYSDIYEFETPETEEEVRNYRCGTTPNIQINGTTPLAKLGINQQFTAGDFPVTVQEVQGSNGTFSGLGYIEVPYLADTKIAVVFDNVKINDEYQMYGGAIETTYDVNESNIVTTEEIADTFEDLYEGVKDIISQLDIVIENIKQGKLTNEDLDGISDFVKNKLPEKKVEKLQEKIAELKEINNQLNQSNLTDEEKDALEKRKKELEKELEEGISEFKEELVNWIVKALKKYYANNKRNETQIFEQYENLFDYSENKNTQQGFNEEGTSSWKFIKKVTLKETPSEFTEINKMQMQYHTYLIAKSISLNSDNELFVNRMLQAILEEQNIDSTLQELLNSNKTDDEIIDALQDTVKEILEAFINKNKYNHLEENEE